MSHGRRASQCADQRGDENAIHGDLRDGQNELLDGLCAGYKEALGACFEHLDADARVLDEVGRKIRDTLQKCWRDLCMASSNSTADEYSRNSVLVTALLHVLHTFGPRVPSVFRIHAWGSVMSSQVTESPIQIDEAVHSRLMRDCKSLETMLANPNTQANSVASFILPDLNENWLIELCRWYYSSIVNTITRFDFVKAARISVSALYALLTHEDDIDGDLIVECLQEAVDSRSPRVIKMLEQFVVGPRVLNHGRELLDEINEVFWITAEENYADGAKIFLEWPIIDPMSGDGFAMRHACKNGHVKMAELLAQYMYSLPPKSRFFTGYADDRDQDRKSYKIALRAMKKACNDRRDKLASLLLVNNRLRPLAGHVAHRVCKYGLVHVPLLRSGEIEAILHEHDTLVTLESKEEPISSIATRKRLRKAGNTASSSDRSGRKKHHDLS